jgi:hypothetical protein
VSRIPGGFHFVTGLPGALRHAGLRPLFLLGIWILISPGEAPKPLRLKEAGGADLAAERGVKKEVKDKVKDKVKEGYKAVDNHEKTIKNNDLAEQLRGS